jgi:lipoate---protein ligase
VVPFRWIDTGLRGGRENIAFDQALISLHAARRIPDTLRFLHFRPCVLVGRHQVLEEAVDLAACREAGVEVGRRVTGGGALYLDEGQLGWELVFARAHLPFADLAGAARAICEAACTGLARLGIEARFRPRNDIEVEGRKIGGTGGFFEGGSLFYQGTMLVRFDPARMVRLLRVPAAKLARHGAETAARRIVTLSELMGDAVPSTAEVAAALAHGFAEGLGLALEPSAPSPPEEEEARRLSGEEIGTDAFVGLDSVGPGEPAQASASVTAASGTIRLDLFIEGRGEPRIREALISGDFFATPPRAVLDLEAALRGVPLTEADAALRSFLAGTRIGGLDEATLRGLLTEALASAGGPRRSGHPGTPQ